MIVASWILASWIVATKCLLIGFLLIGLLLIGLLSTGLLSTGLTPIGLTPIGLLPIGLLRIEFLLNLILVNWQEFSCHKVVALFQNHHHVSTTIPCLFPVWSNHFICVVHLDTGHREVSPTADDCFLLAHRSIGTQPRWLLYKHRRGSATIPFFNWSTGVVHTSIVYQPQRSYMDRFV